MTGEKKAGFLFVLILAGLGMFQIERRGNISSRKDKTVAIETLFDAINSLDRIDFIKKSDVEGILNVSLELDSEHSNHFFLFYSGKGAGSQKFLWAAAVDFRVPQPAAKAKGIFLLLNLNRDLKLRTSDVTNRYGQPTEVQVLPPPPGETSSLYIYKRKQGSVRFGIRSGSGDEIATVVIDRTE